jgi:hypothetical protein
MGGLLQLILVVALVAAAIGVTIWSLRRQALAASHRAQQMARERDQAVRQRDAAVQKTEQIIGALKEDARERLGQRMNGSKPYREAPRGMWPTLERLERVVPTSSDPFAFAVGWEEKNQQPGIVGFTLREGDAELGNAAITGKRGRGKTSLAFFIMGQLCKRATPAQFRVFIVDPKVVDGALWRGKAHNWREPVLGADIPPVQAAAAALKQEREDRQRLLERHSVVAWEQLHPAARPPHILVYVSELSILEEALPNAEQWLTREMQTSRAAGITYMVDTQNLSGRETAWRSQVGTFLAGYQDSVDAVRPNIGMSPEEIRKLGGIPMHELPGRGCFTVREGRNVMSVYVPEIPIDDRKAFLATLPDAGLPLQVGVPKADQVEQPLVAATVGGSPSGEGLIVVPPEERAKILAEIERVRTQPKPSRSKVCKNLYLTRGGRPYNWVKQVADEIGWLVSEVETEAEVSELQASPAGA